MEIDLKSLVPSIATGEGIDPLTGGELIGVEIAEDGVEVIRRKKSHAYFTVDPPIPVPDLVWKEVYHIVDGRLKFIDKVRGHHTPGYNVSESFEFDE